MKVTDGLLSSLDTSWREFSRARKKARAKASEKSIHDLRVNTRRLIATLELMRALSRNDEISDLQRRVKKILKYMGRLRDVQVQLEGVSEISGSPVLQDFTRRLERVEKREIKTIRKKLKQAGKRRLSKQVSRIHADLVKKEQRADMAKVERAVQRILLSRRSEFLKTHRRFAQDDATLHDMRIALKKFRYAVEAAQPLLDDSVKRSAAKMHGFQQLMGNTRDIAILRGQLQKWAVKKGKKLAVVPVLDQLQEKQQTLLKKITESSADLEAAFPASEFKPRSIDTSDIGTSETDDIPITQGGFGLAKSTNGGLAS